MSEKWLHQHQAALRLLFLFDASPPHLVDSQISNQISDSRAHVHLDID